MKLIKTIFIFLIILYLFYSFLKNKNKDNIYHKKTIQKVNTTVDIPKPTNISQKLSKGEISPLKQNDRNLKNEDPIKYIRNLYNTDPITTDEDYLNKDIISPNPKNTTELRFVEENDEKAWSDVEVSQHPKYYTSKFNNELTDPSEFFKYHQFNDKTSPYSENNLPDRCSYNNNNEIICSFNNKLENIPPKLIDSKNQLINNIGNENIYKNKISSEISNINDNYYQSWNYNDEKISNGAEFMDGLSGNETNFNSLNLDLNSIDTTINYSI